MKLPQLLVIVLKCYVYSPLLFVLLSPRTPAALIRVCFLRAALSRARRGDAAENNFSKFTWKKTRVFAFVKHGFFFVSFLWSEISRLENVPVPHIHHNTRTIWSTLVRFVCSFFALSERKKQKQVRKVISVTSLTIPSQINFKTNRSKLYLYYFSKSILWIIKT